MTTVPSTEAPAKESIDKGRALVEKWALRFGFGSYSRRVRKMPKAKREHYYALVYFDHEEEFFEVELVPDGTLPMRQLEYVVIHEMTHGLVGYAHQHVSAEEVICNRVARAFTRSKGPNEHHYASAPKQPKASQPERMSVLVDALPDKERRVIEALYYEHGERTHSEIADELGVSKGTVGRIRDRALKRMGMAIAKKVGRE